MSAILPALSVFLAVLATALPLGLPADATFVLPLVVVMMVFCWRTMPHAILPPAVAMLLGLLTDVTTGGPIGYWGLMALAASSAGKRMRPLAEQRGATALCLAWLPLVLMLAGSGWLLASLYFFRWVDWNPFVFGALVSIALFPAVLYTLLKLSNGGFEPRRRAFGGQT